MSRVVVYDLETTGYSYKKERPIEIAAKVYENGELTDSYKALIKNPRLLHPKIIRLTNITDQMLKDEGIDLEDGLKDIYNIINVPDTILVGYNHLNFDNMFLTRYFSEILDKKMPKVKNFDCMCHFKALLLHEPKIQAESFYSYHKRVANKRKSGVKFKLEDACDHYNVNTERGFHRAETDLDYTYEIFLKQTKGLNLN